ncbi:zinc-binding dehydrogenase [uncultured Micrococcus sp.]|uniref:zinc-binding dehydrogenase n=1 Tax=uncultured Micrococcus sp. TaxID=114051 RepID=UPI00345DF672
MTEAGAEVKDVKVGDRVIISCVSTCMDCSYCREGLTSHCQAMGGIGWVFGHLIDGTQAELVRVPFADNGLIPLPEGDTVLVVGAGPVGLSAIMTAAAKGASTIIAVDGNEFRLESARKFGATHTFTPGEDTTAKVKELTADGLGVDGKPVEFPIDREWINNITITTGLVNATTAPELLGRIQNGSIKPEEFVTHRFMFDQWDEAYEMFAHAADEKALKVIVTAQ